MSSVPGNDAQNESSVLNHPLQWIDTRIFGWSRSSVLGPKAWNAPPTSAQSETSSPPESDGEMDDDVDYDDVLAIIDVSRKGLGGRGRRRSSPSGNHKAYKTKSDDAISATAIEDAKQNGGSALRERKARVADNGDVDEEVESNTVHSISG